MSAAKAQGKRAGFVRTMPGFVSPGRVVSVSLPAATAWAIVACRAGVGAGVGWAAGENVGALLNALAGRGV